MVFVLVLRYVKKDYIPSSKPKSEPKSKPSKPKPYQNQNLQTQNHIKTKTLKTKTISKPKPYQNQNFKISFGFGACLIRSRYMPLSMFQTRAEFVPICTANLNVIVNCLQMSLICNSRS